MICETQKKVVDFLSSPESYDGKAVKRIDTHLSHVFLVGDRAYKIKRAVRYDFADFSTLEKRKSACDKEVSVNRRTAPKMYVGVLPVYSDGDALSWVATGEIVEWVVVMVRFDASDQFDDLIADGKLDKKTVAKLADNLAEFHLDAEQRPVLNRRASMDNVIDHIAGSLHELEIGTRRRSEVARWEQLAISAFHSRHNLLAARRRHGFVRHCHGDLHLANICLFEGEPTPFDAIEFNDALSDVDVLYDLAFTLMDFVFHDRGDLANLFLNRYLSRTRDYAGLGLLSLFQSSRAAVRAMVMSMSEQPARADRYLDLALEYLIGESVPQLIAIGGYSGSGKSTVAEALAPELNGRAGGISLNSDVVRKRLWGVRPETTLPEDAYKKGITKKVYRILMKDARRAVRAGQTVIVDATFQNPRFRAEIEEVASAAGVPFDGFWLVADPEQLAGRITQRKGSASDATVNVLNRQVESGCGDVDWRRVHTGGPVQQSVHEILASLGV